MYLPRERIRHALPISTAPTREEAERARLFSPLVLASGLSLSDRTWVPAMVPWRATEDGYVTRDVLAWYRRFAEGAPGVIVIEATGIRDVPSGPLLRIGHDRFIEGLASLTETVKRASGGRTRIFIQLIDFLRIRRRPDPARYFAAFLAVTPRHRAQLEMRDASDAEVRARLASLDRPALSSVLTERELESLEVGDRERVTDVEIEAIRDLPRVLPDLFADAAARAREAGFDGIELHYAHAYTMASFLSARNDRGDGYGGSTEGRARLPLEVYRAVRDRVGAGFTVGARFLCDEIIEGGSTVEDAKAYAVAFARAGMDFLSLSTGGKFEDAKQPKVGEAAYPYTGRSGFECMPPALSDARGPFGRNIGKQSAIRAAVRAAGHDTPVVVAGGIGDFALAEGILARGEGDIVAAARQTLCDPDWFLKLRLGRGAEIRRCTYTNYCEGLDQKHRKVTCKLWDRLDLEDPTADLTDEGRRRLVAPPFGAKPPG